MGILSALWGMVAARWGMCRTLPVWTLVIPLIYLVMHTSTWYKLKHRDGSTLNPLLGETARNMLIFTLLLTLVFIIYS